MQSIKQIQRLNERELENAVAPSASWHTDYRDTAYIYIGGLPLELSEGDVVTIFSQCGEPVWVRLARDKETGKSRGFAWLKYEDQRSCDLAVDNLSGASVMGRLLAVDHTRYQKRKDEDEMEGYVGQDKRSDRDPKRRRTMSPESASESEEEARAMIKEEIELAKLLNDHDDDDPMKAYMIEQKKEEVDLALKALAKSERKPEKHKHRHRSDKDRIKVTERDSGRRQREGPRSTEDRDERSHRHRSRRDWSVTPRRDTSHGPKDRRDIEERRERRRSRSPPRQRSRSR